MSMTPKNVLIVGLNWVGDSIMSMPALQRLRRTHADAKITMLVKKSVAPLWELHAAPHDRIMLSEGFTGTLETVRRVASRGFDVAYILPNSWRSALIPLLARVPCRIGMPGHLRSWMLTDVVRLDEEIQQKHQAYEYVMLMAPEHIGSPLDSPQLWIPEEVTKKAAAHLDGLSISAVGFVPGAARGPAKRWPTEHFIELGRRLAREEGYCVVLFGSAREVDLCGHIADAIGPSARNLAGRTSLQEWAALLRKCAAVVANDSGGMHLAAAVGTPLVAIYGITDPAKTGPLGESCRIIQHSDTRSRDVARHSKEAREKLAAIRPDEVFDAVMKWLRG